MSSSHGDAHIRNVTEDSMSGFSAHGHGSEGTFSPERPHSRHATQDRFATAHGNYSPPSDAPHAKPAPSGTVPQSYAPPHPQAFAQAQPPSGGGGAGNRAAWYTTAPPAINAATPEKARPMGKPTQANPTLVQGPGARAAPQPATRAADQASEHGSFQGMNTNKQLPPPAFDYNSSNVDSPLMGSASSSDGHYRTPDMSNEKLNEHTKRNGHGAQQPLALNADNGDDDDYLYEASNKRTPWYRTRLGLSLLALLVLLIVACASVIPAVVVTQTRNNGSNRVKSDTYRTTKNGENKIHSSATTGGDGSTVYAYDGSSFRYNNTFGGTWNAQPFNYTARAQSFSPSLIEEWDFNNDRIQGVNLGGWLVLEPFIVPHMFEPYVTPGITNGSAVGVIDEWTLSEAMGEEMADKIEEHYRTFITEHDFAEIAGAGLNWVRIPIGFWAIETWDPEPMLEKVSWKYLLQALEWARKYGIRVCIDLHAVPGSQNGYNHSGKQGSINMLSSAMGVANAQRTLNYIRTLTEFFSQPEYSKIVPFFTVLNEPYTTTIGADTLRSFYIEAYNTVREVSGTGAGKGPMIVFHDGFQPLGSSMEEGGWNGFMQGADRVLLDTHTYLCFTTPNDDSLQYNAAKPCSFWSSNLNTSSNEFGLTIAGEFSLAVNDCGKWLNNIHNGPRYNGSYYLPGNTTAPHFQAVGSCDKWDNWESWDETTKSHLRDVARGHMDAFRNWFYWTWKTAYSPAEGKIVNPFWNYQLGHRENFIPKDPRDSRGFCEVVVPQQGLKMSNVPVSPMPASRTGSASSYTISAAETSSFPWPPNAVGGTPASNLPTFTPTGSVYTLPVQTPTLMPSAVSTSRSLDGWYNSKDTAGFYTPKSGCSYPPVWSAAAQPAPTGPAC